MSWERARGRLAVPPAGGLSAPARSRLSVGWPGRRTSKATAEYLQWRWKETLGEEFDLGIGLNTGVAQVGNTGTQRKFKYGPLGPDVNLASRITQMT